MTVMPGQTLQHAILGPLVAFQHAYIRLSLEVTCIIDASINLKHYDYHTLTMQDILSISFIHPVELLKTLVLMQLLDLSAIVLIWIAVVF